MDKKGGEAQFVGTIKSFKQEGSKGIDTKGEGEKTQLVIQTGNQGN